MPGELAARLKADRFADQSLAGPRAVAVIFDKPTLRTQGVPFATGIAELGGHPLVIDSGGTHAGRGETVGDLGRVLSRQVSAIVWRTFGQDRLAELAQASTVPVVFALTDQFHPLPDPGRPADHPGRRRRLSWAFTLTFLGDSSSNMAHSYLLGGATAGMHVRICGPAQYAPAPAVVATAVVIAARTGGSVSIGADPDEAAKGTPTSWPPTSGRRWARKVGAGQDRGHGPVPAGRGPAGPGRCNPAPGCCTACPRTAARRSPRRCWTGRAAGSGTRPRTGCTHRRAAVLSWLIAESR